MFDHPAEREIRRNEDEIQRMNMRKKLKYEKPFLTGFSEVMTASGMYCTSGDGIYGETPLHGNPCTNGSCVDSAYCHTGSKAESCCSGSSACESDPGSCTSCATGSGVSGFVQTGLCVCSYGAGACFECTSGGSGTWCGTGGGASF
jgi:hypothetical protein